VPQDNWVHDCFGDDVQPGCCRGRKADPIPNFWPRDRGRIRRSAAGRLRSRHPFHRTYKVNEASAAETSVSGPLILSSGEMKSLLPSQPGCPHPWLRYSFRIADDPRTWVRRYERFYRHQSGTIANSLT
jgi:hypothetical protein